MSEMNKNNLKGVTINDFFARFGYLSKEELISFIKKGLRYGYIYTHSGNEFHADEVFSIALLEIYRNKLNKEANKEIYPPFKVIRSRNISKSNKILKLDVDNSVLDHHFPKNEAAFRENGIQYATAGILWYILGNELVEERFVQTIDSQIFEPLDACDNGMNGIISQYSDMVATFVPNWNENHLILEEQMKKAIDFAITILERKISEFNAIDLAKISVEKSYKASLDKRIILLSKAMNWQEVLVPTEALFVIWKNDNKWSCQAVPTEIGSFQLKKGFHSNWRGLRNEVLKEQSGLDLEFCHSTGFYLVANTKEAAIEACKKSL